MTKKRIIKGSSIFLGAVVATAVALLNLEFSATTQSQNLVLQAKIGVNDVAAGNRKKATKKNKSDCNKWCDAHENCEKCSTKRGCGSGLKNLKTWGGKGKNYHACEKNNWGKESEKNKKDCMKWCEGNSKCVYCDTKNGCGLGYKSMKHWRGKGKNYHACTAYKIETDRVCDGRDTLYCSSPWPAGFIIGSFIPKWNAIFHDACVRHDYCYVYGNMTYGKTQKQCDEALYQDMKTICKNRHGNDPNCYKNATAYYGGVRGWGDDHFHKNGKCGKDKHVHPTFVCKYPDKMTTASQRKVIGDCFQWCKGDKQCKFCSDKPDCGGNGSKKLRAFSGAGVSWHGCS